MNTKPLERFATQARRDLLAAVDAQATAVLAPGSVARTERGEAVKTLEVEITAHGRPHVIDKVAYTWFNRIIALRFMDACSYTDAGVVSPAQGQAHGQPEILADAKRGNLDADVVINRNTEEAIIGLLDGTRRSSDAEGEAYALLLTEYCRYWHKSMPYMFEPEGDYTELLVPMGLLADGAILSEARKVLTDEVCDDVEVIGWLYQFYISERKQDIFDSKVKRGAEEIPAATQLFTPHWIVRYLVENSLGRLWMLNRPTSRLVDQMDYYIAPVDEETKFLRIAGPEELTVIDPACGSGHMLTHAFDLLYAIYEEEGFAPSDIPGLILTHNLYGTEIDPRAGALAAFALTMKARAKQRTFFNKQVEPNICVIERISFSPDELDFLVTKSGDKHAEEDFWNQFRHADILGALIQPDPQLTARSTGHLGTLDFDGDMLASEILERARGVVRQAEFLLPRYDVVVTNPPYMGSGNMSDALAAELADRFANGKSDLMTAFMLRSSGLTRQDGFWAIIDLPSWMVLKSYEKLRLQLFAAEFLVCMAQFGRGVWGSDFGSVGFVFQKAAPNGRHGSYRKLFERHVDVRSNAEIEALFRDSSYNAFTVSQDDYSTIPGSPVVYWLSEAVRRAFTDGVPLNELAEPRQGLLTGDSDSFVRQWWEVSGDRTSLACDSRETARASRARWFPYNKGGEFRKWYGNHEHLVNWEDDGRVVRTFGAENGGRVRSRPQNADYYFRPSVSWSNVSSGAPAFRSYPPGFIAAGSTGDGVYPRSDGLAFTLLGILNSSVTHELLAAIAPTITFNVGTIANLPIIQPPPDSELESGVRKLITIAREDWNQSEMSWGFETNSLMSQGSTSVEEAVRLHHVSSDEVAERARFLEQQNNEYVAKLYGLAGDVETNVDLSRVSLSCNTSFKFGAGMSGAEYKKRFTTAAVQDLVSYAIGCMFGRYSPDEKGLILADQCATVQEYFARVPEPTFPPDTDNVIPLVDDGWFEDDIVERFRQFLRRAFGEERFEENLRFVGEALGVKNLRDYFITRAGKSKFYDDHVQRYKKRPIYWMFSSPRGSFNALIYMHRYNPSTVPTVLNEYLREYRAKLEVALINAEQAAAAGSTKDLKEADRLRKVIAELRDYEHDVLYPLATQQLTIDLSDGVKANYPKFYPALKKIVGLEAAE
ncbi:BREX-1 system adenine-specific DNA-methyltransferase PglX [Arthrobacter sp. efr-133-TYG-104]|uniref:BREX-1 system adenine-specific DNA-methyltransferase PglX n=1 Tax=Arthrobacter sp. efr-133-TYG-104 TaxID=3040324 RepID=UPI00254B41B3|nr:BREX-1 system adenine-specific DNA-methyltransferase PglX [Arthrobacter sp. efr-133-TYG-104]